MCDGSIRSVSYSISPRIHALLAHRADGHPIDASQIE
jgi:hypothetical protein